MLKRLIFACILVMIAYVAVFAIEFILGGEANIHSFLVLIDRTESFSENFDSARTDLIKLVDNIPESVYFGVLDVATYPKVLFEGMLTAEKRMQVKKYCSI